MQINIRKQFVQIASVLLLALGTVTAAHAVSEPIQTQRGVVRLGSKTQANVDAKGSSVAIGEGMVLISSNPGRLGRPALKVSFNGAPMHAKVQGTALIAYLPREFIQITGIEGRTYLVREGRLGEVVAIDAGKMLLVKPAAKRLPETADINLGYFVENSPMFNGGLKLAASSLIARAIEEQSGNRYLKSTPIYFEGAGSEAVVASENPELPSIGDGLGDEGQPLDTSLTGIDAIERIPRKVAGPQLLPQQLVAAQTNSSPGVGAGTTGIGAIPPPPGLPLTPPQPRLAPDVAGAPEWGKSTQNTEPRPSRGFLEEFTDDPTRPRDGQQLFWLSQSKADQEFVQRRVLSRTNLGGFVQGVRTGTGNAPTNFLIFGEAKIPDSAAETAFKITPTLGGSSNIILKFSNDDVPSDILNPVQFKKAFRVPSPPPPSSVTLSDADPTRATNTIAQQEVPIDSFAPLDKNTNPPRLEMTLVVPPEGITIKDRFFETDTVTQPNEAIDLPAGKFPVLGLAAPTFLGSVFVDVTSGNGVRVEVGDRALTFGLNDDELGIFSLQAAPSDATVTGGAPGASSGLTFESDGALNIPLNIPLGLMTGATVVSKQSIGVQSASSELVFSEVTLAAGQGIAVSSSGELVFSEATLAAGQGIAVSSSGRLVFSNTKLNAGQGIAVSSSGELVFSEATLAAGHGIALSSPIGIRFNNSSQLAAGTAVVMEGAGTAAIEMVNSTVTAPNGEIRVSGGELVFTNTKLNAGQGIAVSSSGELVFSEATLAAGKGIAVLSPIVMQGAGIAGLKMVNSTATAPNGEIRISGGEPVFTNTKLNAGQGIAVSSSGELVFSEATLASGQGIALSSPTVMQGAGSAALEMVNSTVTAPNGQIRISGGELVFTNTKFNAGQGIAVSSPKRIRFDSSSDLAAVTAVVMQGAGTAALEVVNSAITTPNRQIFIDQFDRIQMESATLIASVIRARVVSPSGVLQISNSTLEAEKLLRLYAEGSHGMVEFVGAVNLSGRKIDIAGKRVRVKQKGTVTTGPNTTVYARTRQYNKQGFGKISEHKQENFKARPSF